MQKFFLYEGLLSKTCKERGYLLLKVIIADDEIKVCQLICHLVNWKDMGMEIIAIVNDGKKAFDEIYDKKPDIVITDIRMPNYDGIELIRKTKEILPDTYFIVVSGYSQFEYAKSAIQYGVENYLLKPIKSKELINTLTKIIEKYNLKLSDSAEKKDLKMMLQTSEEKVKRNLLAEILMNPENNIADLGIEALNREFCCHFEEGFYAILIIKPFLELEDKNKESLSLLLTKILCSAKEKLEICCREVITIIWEEQVLCLINTEAPALTLVKKQLNKVRIEISSLKDIFHNIRVIIGIGQVMDKLTNLYFNIQQAELSVMNRFAKTGEYIIEYQDSFVSERTVAAVIDGNVRNKILSYFEVLDIDNILEEITKLQKLLEGYSYDSQLVYHCYNEIVNIMIYGVKNYMSPYEIPEQAWYQKKFKSFLTIEDIFKWLKNHLSFEFEKYTNEKKIQDSKPIRQAKQYINQNYNKDINLEDVSNLIGFNPAYFSSLFKKETGENFMEYIMKIRIQNAKFLLIQTDKDIADIASDVGYMDLKYFSKLFKKKTGLNPSEFRKLYS